MPGRVIMNDDYQLAAATPLDLTTSTRRLQVAGQKNEDGSGCVGDARADGGSPSPPACTGTGTDGARQQLLSNAPSRNGGVSRKRALDSPSCKLPFRKRPIPLEPVSAAPSTNSQEDPEQITGPGHTSTALQRIRFEGRVGVTPVAVKQEETSLNLDRHSWFMRPHYAITHPVCCHFPVPEPHHLGNCPPEGFLAGISLATHQDEDGDTALHIAVVQEKSAIVLELIQLLLCARRKLDVYNNLRQTPLHLAVITKQPRIVEVLLNSGADPAALDRHGQTALHLCCEYDQSTCMGVLLSHASSQSCLEIRNFEGLSPLHMTVRRGHQGLTKMLLDARADINAMDIKSGQSPLMHSVESNNVDMVRFLIENGCDVNSQSYSGNTALHIACGRGQVDIVRLLLKNGADSSHKNYHNDTPLMVAKNKKVVDVLRGRGSKQIRDQDCLSVLTYAGASMENGSQSCSHSHGSLATSTPHSFRQSPSHSPNTSFMQFPFH